MEITWGKEKGNENGGRKKDLSTVTCLAVFFLSLPMCFSEELSGVTSVIPQKSDVTVL